MKDGYILLYRKIEENELWKEKPFDKARAWIDLLLMANFKDSDVILKGQLVHLKRGQLVRSLDSLAERWGWSIGKVQRYLKMLKKQKNVQVNGYSFGQVITIENYERFQNARYENGLEDEQPDEQPDEQREKESNKESKRRGAFDAPTLADVSAYVRGMGYQMDPAAFYDYYSETEWIKKNGQKVRDWKAAVRTWERREKEFKKAREKNPPEKPAQIEPPKYKQFEPEPKVDAVPMPASVREKLKSIELLEDLQ